MDVLDSFTVALSVSSSEFESESLQALRAVSIDRPRIARVFRAFGAGAFVRRIEKCMVGSCRNVEPGLWMDNKEEIWRRDEHVTVSAI